MQRQPDKAKVESTLLTADRLTHLLNNWELLAPYMYWVSSQEQRGPQSPIRELGKYITLPEALTLLELSNKPLSDFEIEAVRGRAIDANDIAHFIGNPQKSALFKAALQRKLAQASRS